MAPDMLKCRFCDWRTMRFRRLKNGQLRHGYTRLAGHVEQAHQQEYEAIIQRVLADEDSDPETLPERKGEEGR